MTTKHNPRLPGYFFVEALGSGSYGTVYKARTTSKRISFVAIKCILRSSLTKSGQDNLITEIEVLKKLKHPNIVELVEFQWDDHYVFLIMELCAAGDLSKFLRSQPEKRVSERQTREFTCQLCAALEFMSSKTICHMDLKPHNILLTYFLRSTGLTKASGGAAALGVGARLEPRLKIADFGFAKHMDREGANEDDTLRGSYLYMAPEVLTHRDYSDKCDIWSLGVIIYECLTSQAPYASRTLQEVIAKIIQQKEIRIPTDLRLSDECVDCLSRLLQREPSRRISLSELLVHPFVSPHSPSSNGTSLLPDARNPRRTSLLNAQPNATTTRLGDRLSQLSHPPGPNGAQLPPPAILNPSDPPAEMLHAAKSLCEQAAEYRQQNKHTEAYSIYLRASEMLIPVLRSLPDSTLKTEVKQQINICLDAAECLKTLVRSSSANASSETPEDGGQDSAHSAATRSSRSRPPNRPPPFSENSHQKAKQSESAAATPTPTPNGATEGPSHAGTPSDSQRPLTPQHFSTPPPSLTLPDSKTEEVEEQATEANEELYFDASSLNASPDAHMSDRSLSSSVCYAPNTLTNACHSLPTCSPGHSEFFSLSSTCANTGGNRVQASSLSPSPAEAAQSAILSHILRHDPKFADEATAALMSMSNADQILALDDGNFSPRDAHTSGASAEVEHVKLALGIYEQALQVLLDRVGGLTSAEQQLLLPELNKYLVRAEEIKSRLSAAEARASAAASTASGDSTAAGVGVSCTRSGLSYQLAVAGALAANTASAPPPDSRQKQVKQAKKSRSWFFGK